MERAYLLKPQYGKQSKANVKTFSDIEANYHKFVPGPIYNTAVDWSKDFPHNKGQFLKGERMTSEEKSLKKEKDKPSPAHYNNLEAWKATEPATLGNFKQ